MAGHPFDHDALAERRLDEITDQFKSRRAFLLPAPLLLFTCGGPTAPGAHSTRAKFLSWAKQNLPSCRVFLAEAATRDLLSDRNEERLNLAHFETFIGDVADRVLIFPESVGSYAETGYFSAIDLVKKCWVINDYTHDHHSSFLNRGPIALIEERSRYPKVILGFAGDPLDFSRIKEVIDAEPKKKRAGVQMGSFKTLSGREQLAVLLYLVGLFPSIDIEGIKRLLIRIFGPSKWEVRRVRELLSILISADYVRELEHDANFRYVVRPTDRLLELDGVDPDEIRMTIIEIYSKHFPSLLPPT